MKLSANQKIVLGLTIGLCSVIVLTLLGILPAASSLRTTASNIEQERIHAELVTRERQNDVVTEREFDNLKSASDDLEKYFVKEATVLEFLTSLEQSASSHTVALSISSLQPPSQGTAESQLELVARGTFHHLLDFVHALEALPAYFSVERLAWTATEPGAQSITLRGKIFWQ